MLKLYHFPRSPDPTSPAYRGVRSVRPRWLLEELGVPYELVCLDAESGEHKQADYLAINPNGTVPALVDGECQIFELAAICAYLADRFPEKNLAPAIGTNERALYYQWLFYAATSIETPVEQVAWHTWGLPPEERSSEALAEAIDTFQSRGRVLSDALDGQSFILGDDFSAADIMLSHSFLWLEDRSVLGSFPILDAYLKRLLSRPAVERAMTG